ncbi:MAG: hypothetical protein K2K82_00670 [Muribaculaceae bacterium]|nr:hypothetical protein [Muribaculaceae bacterium]
MAIDNFKRIEVLFRHNLYIGYRDSPFMHVRIVRRGKDHPNLPGANKIIKSCIVQDYERLEKMKEDIISICEHCKARAYISCVPKGMQQLNTYIMCRLADNQHIGNVINPYHIVHSACGKVQSVEKRWVVDVDTKDPETLNKIKDSIDKLWGKAHPQDWGRHIGQTWLIAEIPTLNGVHLITRPFNLQEFNQRFPEVEIKKNGLTALYVPDCITANTLQ